MPLRDFIENLTPVADLPITWDSTGYTSEAFNKAAQEDSFEGWSGDLLDEEEADTITELLNTNPGDSLLDVACGYGRHALELAECHELRVTGVDISPGLIAAARILADERSLDIVYEVKHGRDIDYADAFDHAIIGFNSLSVFSPEDAALTLQKIRTALKPGGRLFLDVDNKPFYTRYGSSYRNWYTTPNGLTLTDVYFHHDTSVEVIRDILINDEDGSIGQFICFKRIYDESDIRYLLEQNGFAIQQIYGNWDLMALSDISPKIILTATVA